MKLWTQALCVIASLLLSLPAAADALRLQLEMAPAPAQTTRAGTLSLTVTDQRPSSIPGLSADGEALRIADDLSELIRQTVGNALQQRGYSLVADKGRHQLHIKLNTLSYQAEKKFLRSSIHVEVVLQAIVTRGKHTLTKTFHGKNDYEVALSPSDEENSHMLSETITHALDSMLSDAEIHQALQ